MALSANDVWIPEVMQEAKVEAISNEQCQNVYGTIVTENHICAGTGMPNACSVSIMIIGKAGK